MSNYNMFVETGDRFIPFKVDGTHQDLPSGCYSPEYDYDRGQVIFNKLKLNCDDIVNLPSKEYDYVTSQMTHFLKPETKQKYIDNGFLYKRSVLMYGKPGTGKTCIVNKITQNALGKNAVVLFNPDPREIHYFFEALEATAPDKLTLVIFEEFDDLVRSGSATEKALLSVLDGEIQKNNIIYLATTNYIDEIPLRMQRPGRFSSIVEVNFPNIEARSVFLKAKQVSPELVKTWSEMTEGFSIDELKETVLAVRCLDEKLETVVNRIRDLKERGLQSESKKKEREAEQVEFVREFLAGTPAKARR